MDGSRPSAATRGSAVQRRPSSAPCSGQRAVVQQAFLAPAFRPVAMLLPSNALSSSAASSLSRVGPHPDAPRSRACRALEWSPDQALQAFENWRLDLQAGGLGAAHVSEFADIRPAPSTSASPRREAYCRPVNKRDLGHLCCLCRRPFSNLGVALVVELHGGPSQRYHVECWQKFRGRKPPALYERQVTSVAGQRQAVDVEEDIVAIYADEWRRASLERDSSPCVVRRHRDTQHRRDPLISMNTFEDEHGRRWVARGFTQQEVDLAMDRWACCAAPDDECAICFAALFQPLQLPCCHSFCSQCVEPWLKRCALCPICREELHPPSEMRRHVLLSPRSGAGPSQPPCSGVSSPQIQPSVVAQAGRKPLALVTTTIGFHKQETHVTQRVRARVVHVRKTPFVDLPPFALRGALPGRVLTSR